MRPSATRRAPHAKRPIPAALDLSHTFAEDQDMMSYLLRLTRLICASRAVYSGLSAAVYPGLSAELNELKREASRAVGNQSLV